MRTFSSKNKTLKTLAIVALSISVFLMILALASNVMNVIFGLVTLALLALVIGLILVCCI